MVVLNSFLASGDFCRLLTTFSNSLAPDQDRKNFSPDLDSNSLTLKEIVEKVNYVKKKSRQTSAKA